MNIKLFRTNNVLPRDLTTKSGDYQELSGDMIQLGSCNLEDSRLVF